MLSYLDAPSLQVIWMRNVYFILENNFVTSLRSLKRVQLPSLAFIRVSQNYLCDSFDLTDGRISFSEHASF